MSGLNDIPLGSCYRKVHELVEGGVLIVERIAMTDGKRCELFRSAYQSFVIEVENGSFKADVVINENIAEKLRAIWLSMKPLPTSH